MNPATVLFIDDDADDRFMLQHAYKKAGLPTPAKFLESAKAAVDFLTLQAEAGLSRVSFESIVIFLDLNMPVMNGFEFLEWIRQQPTLRAIPVLILSTSENPTDIKKAYHLGANAYLVKPHSATELSQLLAAAHTFWIGFNKFAQ
jgi:CheY-like chemotaxis protein